MLKQALYYAAASNWLFMLPLYKSLTASKWVTPKDVEGYFINSARYQSNFFHRKPFTCLYCLTFWLTLIGCVAVPALLGGEIAYGACFVSPVLAVAFERWFNSLSVKL